MDSRVDKQVTTDTLIKLAELVLKNSIYEFSDKTCYIVCYTILAIVFAILTTYFFIWEHGEEFLKKFINEINSFHPTTKFTADWSKEKIDFLDVKVTLKNSVLSTDLFVKPTDTHQFLDPTSCHPYHCKKGIPYIQTLTLNSICSDNSNFDKRCNELESWLFEKG